MNYLIINSDRRKGQLLAEVSFTARFAVSSSVDPAYSLTRWLAVQLVEQGLICSEIIDLEYAFTFRCEIAKQSFFLIVGYVGDNEREWLILIDGDRNWRRQLKKFDVINYQVLIDSIAIILSTQPNIQHIYWNAHP